MEWRLETVNFLREFRFESLCICRRWSYVVIGCMLGDSWQFWLFVGKKKALQYWVSYDITSLKQTTICSNDTIVLAQTTESIQEEVCWIENRLIFTITSLCVFSEWPSIALFSLFNNSVAIDSGENIHWNKSGSQRSRNLWTKLFVLASKTKMG